jgi:16S rRNA processing protein RimM
MEAAYLGVARFRKPHGLKGDAVVWVLTDEPEKVLVKGRKLTPVNDDGDPVGEPLEVERARPYHRTWLVKFRDVDDRGVLEQWDQVLFGVPSDELTPLGEGEFYEHDVPGASVIVKGEAVGEATGLIDIPGGKLLCVDVNGREVMVPFRQPILVGVNRAERQIEIDPPPGLMDL